ESFNLNTVKLHVTKQLSNCLTSVLSICLFVNHCIWYTEPAVAVIAFPTSVTSEQQCLCGAYTMKFIEFEDSQEQEKKDLQTRVESLESQTRQLELKAKNYADQSLMIHKEFYSLPWLIKKSVVSDSAVDSFINGCALRELVAGSTTHWDHTVHYTSGGTVYGCSVWPISNLMGQKTTEMEGVPNLAKATNLRRPPGSDGSPCQHSAMNPGCMLLFVFGFVGGAVVINSAILVSLSVLLLVHFSISTGVPALTQNLPRILRKERPISLGIFPLPAGDGLLTPDTQRGGGETPGSEQWKFQELSQPRSHTSLKVSLSPDPLKAVEQEDELSDISQGGSKATTPASTANSDVSAIPPDTPSKEDNEGLVKGTDIPNKSEISKHKEVQAAQETRNVSTDSVENEEKSEVQAIIESTPELDMDKDLSGYKGSSTPTKGIENKAFDRNTESLFEELSSAGSGLIGDVDEGADLLGMGREVENLILENTQLLETKNALNVVKNDLIAKVDELTCEKDVLQGELEAVKQAKLKLEEKNKELEEELKKARAEAEDARQKAKDDDD
ncbi:hypothetical protein STEG23_009814, partial [Scotinomys teguina]